MCHGFFMWFIVGGLIGRLLYRMRRRHAFFGVGQGGQGGNGGWSGGGGWRGRWRGGFQQGEQRNGSDAGRGGTTPAARGAGVLPRLNATLATLELSARQRAEIDEVISRLRTAYGDALERFDHVDLAIAAIAAPSFDAARAEAAVSDVVGPEIRKELVDGFEHVHNILLPEQRAALGESTRR